jgi:hypothetical protein
MAVMRDMIPAFELFQPASVEEAVALLDQHGDRDRRDDDPHGGGESLGHP